MKALGFFLAAVAVGAGLLLLGGWIGHEYFSVPTMMSTPIVTTSAPVVAPAATTGPVIPASAAAPSLADFCAAIQESLNPSTGKCDPRVLASTTPAPVIVPAPAPAPEQVVAQPPAPQPKIHVNGCSAEGTEGIAALQQMVQQVKCDPSCGCVKPTPPPAPTPVVDEVPAPIKTVSPPASGGSCILMISVLERSTHEAAPGTFTMQARQFGNVKVGGPQTIHGGIDRISVPCSMASQGQDICGDDTIIVPLSAQWRRVAQANLARGSRVLNPGHPVIFWDN